MAVKNYLDKTGTLYEWIKIQGYLSSNYATQSMLTSLANSESALNSTQNSQLSSLSTENSTQNSEMASMSASLSEQASQIAILSTSSKERRWSTTKSTPRPLTRDFFAVFILDSV